MAWSSWYSVASTRSSAPRSPLRAASSHPVMSAVSAIALPRGAAQYNLNGPRKCDRSHISFARSGKPAPSSALAVPAPDGGALADRRLFQRPSATRAGLATAPVGEQFQFEVPQRAVRTDEVAQGRPATLDGIGEDP